MKITFLHLIGLIFCYSSFTVFGNASDAVCPPNSDGLLLPHRNCSKYYLCENEDPIALNCPGSTYFNEYEGYCDHRNNVPQCVGGTRPPGPWTTSTTPIPTTTTTTTTTPIPTTTTTTTTTPIPTTTTTTTTTPIPTTTTTTTTPIPTTTTTTTTPIPTTTTTTTTPIPTTTTTTTAIPTTTTTTTTPIPTTTTSTTAEQSTTVSTVETTEAALCPPIGIIQVPYHGNCSLYYLCINGNPVLSQCPRDKLFDPDTASCVNAELVNCPWTLTRKSHFVATN